MWNAELLAEKDLTLQKAMEIVQSMEAATKQSSELRTPSVSVPTSQDIATVYNHCKDLLQMWKQRTSTREMSL